MRRAGARAQAPHLPRHCYQQLRRALALFRSIRRAFLNRSHLLQSTLLKSIFGALSVHQLAVQRVDRRLPLLNGLALPTQRVKTVTKILCGKPRWARRARVIPQRERALGSDTARGTHQLQLFRIVLLLRAVALCRLFRESGQGDRFVRLPRKSSEALVQHPMHDAKENAASVRGAHLHARQLKIHLLQTLFEHLQLSAAAA